MWCVDPLSQTSEILPIQGTQCDVGSGHESILDDPDDFPPNISASTLAILVLRSVGIIVFVGHFVFGDADVLLDTEEPQAVISIEDFA